MIMMKQSISKMSTNIIVSILILHSLEIHFAEHICIKVCCMFITSSCRKSVLDTGYLLLYFCRYYAPPGAYPKTHLHIRTFAQILRAKFVMCNRFSNPKHICTSAHTHEKTLPNGTIKQLFYATFITLIRINNVYTMGV
jgi:hypothetical protein